MIGQIITDKDGIPLDNSGNKIEPSAYNPPDIIKTLFARLQQDYQVAWMLQHRPFQEFDGQNLLVRAQLDQKTFAAYVGCEYVPKHKEWRWKGRKNTSRNKLIGLCARALAGMLYPYVYAKNEQNEEDKMTAQVMRILIEDHLRKAKYEVKFLFMVLSALVNPAVFVQVEYLEILQSIKQKMKDGTVGIIQVIDELLSGLQLNIIPIDEILLSDFYSGTGNIQVLPYIVKIKRIPYDLAKGIYSGKYFNKEGKDLFDYVQAGKTKIFLAGQEHQTFFDVEWTETDRDYVQVATFKYRSEDLEIDTVGGVVMCNEEDPYNTNPMKHRRMMLCTDENGKQDWYSIPLYDVAMSGFEPIDPSGRFAYYKSGAFKQYWDALGEDRMHQLAYDGTYLDVIKPTFLSGVAKADSIVMAPGATVAMPAGATVTPYSLGPNLAAALKMMQTEQDAITDSTQSTSIDPSGNPNVTATQTSAAVQQQKMFFSCFALMISDIINQVGALTVDCLIQNITVGELDYSVPSRLAMKYKTYLSKGKDSGKNVTHKIIFTDKHMGQSYTQKEIDAFEWALYNRTGKDNKNRLNSDQRLYEVDPYKFARTSYSLELDSDKITMKSMGADRQEKILSFNMMSDPRVAPYVDMKEVVNDFVIDEFGGYDPDKYKSKTPPNEMLNGIMGGQGPSQNGASPTPGSNPAGMVVPPQPLQAK